MQGFRLWRQGRAAGGATAHRVAPPLQGVVFISWSGLSMQADREERPRAADADDPATELVGALSADLLQALDAVQFPSFIVDSDRRLRWQNQASIRLLGDLRGKIDSSVVVAEDLPRVQAAFESKKLGVLHTELDVTVRRADGTHVRVAVSSVPLRSPGGEMIGSFGISRILSETVRRANDDVPHLTARQRQTLALLARGCSTAQMAEMMGGLSTHTVRNHVRQLLTNLEANSRGEAVAKGRLANLI
jgi:DNA-binding CsgD family transcriptional regulator